MEAWKKLLERGFPSTGYAEDKISPQPSGRALAKLQSPSNTMKNGSIVQLELKDFDRYRGYGPIK